jgi:MSHA biogenesis protein MshI
VTIAQAAGVFVVGLLLIYGYARWQVASLGEDIDGLEAQRTASMIQLQALSEQSATRPRSRLIDDQMREAERETLQKQRLLRAFQTRSVGNTRGFSPHFVALARHRIDGLWLTAVEVRDDGIAIRGAAEAGELVPRYLARIGKEPAFADTVFAQLQLSRGDDADSAIEFSATTMVERGE